MEIICFGDSNTYGHNPEDVFNMRYPREQIWTEILSQSLCTKVINLGKNGRSIDDGKSEIISLTDFFKDNANSILIIMLGTNDLLCRKTPHEICSGMKDLIIASGIAPEKIILLSPPPLQMGTWVSNMRIIENRNALASQLRILAEESGVIYEDTSSWELPLASDGVHFTKVAHKLFASNLCKALTQLLKI